jgi:hypothetical protein
MRAPRADAAGLGEQPVPSLAVAVDNLLGGVEDAVGQGIVAQMQPKSLDRVELGRVGRQAKPDRWRPASCAE